MKAWILSATVLVAVVAGGLAWWFWPRESKEFAQITQAQNELFQKKEPDLQKGMELFGQIQKLPEAEREKAMNQGMEMMQKRMEQRFEQFANASPEERIRILDDDIDQMNRMFANFRFPTGMRPPQGGGGAAADGSRRGGGPGGFPRWGGSPEERNAFRRGMLDGTTPHFRAYAKEYFTAMMDRRRQRGMPTFGPGR